MESEPGKGPGRCRYSGLCPIYSANVLRPQFEKLMCGTGELMDKRYVPHVPAIADSYVTGAVAVREGDICPAFNDFILREFQGDLEVLLRNVELRRKGKPPVSGSDAE